MKPFNLEEAQAGKPIEYYENGVFKNVKFLNYAHGVVFFEFNHEGRERSATSFYASHIRMAEPKKVKYISYAYKDADGNIRANAVMGGGANFVPSNAISGSVHEFGVEE